MNKSKLISLLERLEEYSKHRSYCQDHYEEYLFSEIWSVICEFDSGDSEEDKSEVYAEGVPQEVDFNISEENFDSKEDNEPEQVFLGGYILPFKWKLDYDKCVFSDAIGKAFTLCSGHVFAEVIFTPLFDKLANLLNTGVIPDGYPEFSGRIEEVVHKDYFDYNAPQRIERKLVINGISVEFEKRVGLDGNVDKELFRFLLENTKNLEDNTFYEKLKFLDLSNSDFASCFSRYQNDIYPFYQIHLEPSDGCELGDDFIKEEFVRMFYLQSSDDDYQGIKSKCLVILNEYFGADYKQQMLLEFREKVVRNLNALVDVDENNDGVLSELLGVFFNEYNIYVPTLEKAVVWERNHILFEGDIVVPKTDWENNVFFFSEYSQLLSLKNVNYCWDNVKFKSDDGLYNIKAKICNDPCDVFDGYISHIAPTFSDISLNRIILPVPFYYEKKNRKEISAWLRVNFALMGYYVKQVNIRKLLQNYDILCGVSKKKSTGFSLKFKDLIDSCLFDSDCFDASLLLVFGEKPSVPLNIVESIIEIITK